MKQNHSGIAVASLVCGIVSTALSALTIPVGIFYSLLGCIIAFSGIVTGIVAITLGAKGKNDYPAGRAIAGFVLGIIGTSLHGILFICFLLVEIFF